MGLLIAVAIVFFILGCFVGYIACLLTTEDPPERPKFQ